MLFYIKLILTSIQYEHINFEKNTEYKFFLYILISVIQILTMLI
jgi:hypothetical protein